MIHLLHDRYLTLHCSQTPGKFKKPKIDIKTKERKLIEAPAPDFETQRSNASLHSVRTWSMMTTRHCFVIYSHIAAYQVNEMPQRAL